MSVFCVLIFLSGDAQAQTDNTQERISCESFSFPGDSATDKEVLIKFYCDTGGPNWDNQMSWGSEEDIGEWHGVDRDENNVVALELPSNKLKGRIPAELGKLNSLETLDLSDNNLTREIPSSLGNLNSLAMLDLSDNNLTREIPSSLGNLNSLETLDLSGNSLWEGEKGLNWLANLELITLNLQENNIGGSKNNDEELSPILKDLLSQTTDTDMNQLKDSLQKLDLSGNELYGKIPLELFTETNIIDLNLSDNNLNGNIPPIPAGPDDQELSSFRNLNLSCNRLDGPIPSGLSKLISLGGMLDPSDTPGMLDLSGNNLSGEIPPVLDNLTSLGRDMLRLSDSFSEEGLTLTLMDKIKLIPIREACPDKVTTSEDSSMDTTTTNDNSGSGGSGGPTTPSPSQDSSDGSEEQPQDEDSQDEGPSDGSEEQPQDEDSQDGGPSEDSEEQTQDNDSQVIDEGDSDGGCSVASAREGTEVSFSAALNLLLIIFSLLSVYVGRGVFLRKKLD